MYLLCILLYMEKKKSSAPLRLFLMLRLPVASSSAQLEEKAKASLRAFFVETFESKLFLLPKHSDRIIIMHRLLHSGKLILQHINAKTPRGNYTCGRSSYHNKLNNEMWNTGETICKMMVFIVS